MDLQRTRDGLRALVGMVSTPPDATAEARRLVAAVDADTPSARSRTLVLKRLAMTDPEPQSSASVILDGIDAKIDPDVMEDAIVQGIHQGIIFHGGHSAILLTEKGRLMVAALEMARAELAAKDSEAREDMAAAALRGT